MAIEKGQTYRILDNKCTWSLGKGDTDFYGLVAGQEFTVDEVDDAGDGWCKLSNLPEGVIPFWIENASDGRLCMLAAGEELEGVELVK